MDTTKNNFSPVENKIREFFPDFQIYVIGIPESEKEWNEIPVLCYVAKNRRTITPSELYRVLAGRFDSQEIPRIVYRLSHLPDEPDETLLRSKLKEIITDGAECPVEQIL